MDRKPIIAVDGVSGSGKSTIARTLARKYGLTYIDTGAMYRALTYYAMQKHYLQEGEFFKNLLIADLNKIEIGFDAQGHTLLNGQDVESEIRSMEVSQNVSLVSSVPEVRRAMVLLPPQRHCDGRTGHRHGRFSRCGHKTVHRIRPASTRTSPLRRTESEGRRGRF